MIRGMMTGYREAVRVRLRAMFVQDHPPHFIGVSFAIGVFVTTLPTLGTGVLGLAALGYWSTWANRLALFASVVILNPIVKTGVHAMSFALGTLLLGPVPEIINPELSLITGREILVRLLVGNVILAIGFALVGYVLAFYGALSISRYSR